MKRKLPTQRQNTFRWVAAALLLLLLTTAFDLWTSHPVFYQEQALRSAETWLGTGETEVLATREADGVTYTLSWNEDALLMTPFRFSLRPTQWNSGEPLLALALDGSPVQATFRDNGTEVQIIGVTSLPEAVSVTVYDPDHPDTPPLQADICQASNGVRYFWFWGNPPSALPTSLDLLDANGNILFTYVF